ncbi:MAG: UDP-2,3-diacylglucosamine diphosphatase [Pseudomonadales bacterium]
MTSPNLREPGKTHYRTIFLSDIHLGTKGCQAERLLHFLKNHTCDRLYLVGDIVDGWRMKSSIYWPQAHSDVLRRFLTLCKRGTRLTYVTGNHDEFLRKYSDLVIGNLEVVDEAVHLTADDRRLLVVHGDEFDVVTRYHRWVAFLGDIGYTLLLGLNRYFNALRSRLGYGYWSLSAWIKHRVKRAVSFISEFEDAIVHQCRKRGFDGVVCGHIHHAEIRDLEGTTYMNCGDWVESCTALVEDEHGRFHILDWSRGAGMGEVVPLPLDAVPERLSA